MDKPLNPYLNTLHQNLPRLLALFNNDSSDRFYGCGDRQFWAWKLIDFPNATMQASAYGMALLYRNNLLPEGFSDAAFLKRITAMIDVLPLLSARNGSLAEALPNEGSFCVTGLVLGDMLGALTLIRPDVDEAYFSRKLNACEPMVKFLMRQDEHHGLISNHLASSALGMIRWGLLTGDEQALVRAGEWLNRIKLHANDEGWMSEYGGADPGYQSWGCTAIAQIHMLTPRYDLEALLKRSYHFLSHFACPDGSFANGIGCRLTRFFFPGGAEITAAFSTDAAELARFARRYYAHDNFVTLNAVDAPNIAPFFNDLALAAVYWKMETQEPSLPYNKMREGELIHFQQAGLLIHRNAASFTMVSVQRGGWVMHIDNAQRKFIIPETNGFDAKGNLLCAHDGSLVRQDGDILVIEAELKQVSRLLPNAFNFILLRLMSLTVFKSNLLGNKVKWILSRLLMQPVGGIKGRVTRHISLSTGLTRDEICGINLRQGGTANSHFSPRHMASQGYWQLSDEQ